MQPISFNTEMIRAILEGRKSVTRRCIKRDSEFEFLRKESDDGKIYIKDYSKSLMWMYEKHYIQKYSKYQVNDILYVQEAWASYQGESVYWTDHVGWQDPLWNPSDNMPQKIARIFLRMTNVKIERLQDIRYYEIYKEGINSVGICNGHCLKSVLCPTQEYDGYCSLIKIFKNLWNSTIERNELNLYDWDANPWVFVYEFEVISKEEAMR